MRVTRFCIQIIKINFLFVILNSQSEKNIYLAIYSKRDKHLNITEEKSYLMKNVLITQIYMNVCLWIIIV